MPENTVALHVITKCGGVKNVAKWLGLHPSVVYKWTYPTGGRQAGLVPAHYQIPLLKIARANGYKLRPVDFFKEFKATN